MTDINTAVIIPRSLLPILGNALEALLPELDEGDFWKFSVEANGNVNERTVRLSLYRDTTKTRKWWDFSRASLKGHEVLGIAFIGRQGELTTDAVKSAVQKCLNYPSRFNTYRIES